MPYITLHVDLRGVPHSFVTLHDANGNMQHYGYGPAKANNAVGPGQVFVGYILDDVRNSAGNFAEVSYSQTTFISQQQYDATLVRIGEWQNRNTSQLV